jgi:EpsI family protein
MHTENRTHFLSSRYARAGTAILVLQAALFYAASRGEQIPSSQPLDKFPERAGEWRTVQRGVIEKEVQQVLRADDTLSRVYSSPTARSAVNLFVAYFKTQRAGQAPHSPKNCLPGAGWVPSSSGVIDVQVAGEAQPIPVNRYVVSRAGEKGVVLYWYQSRARVVANEYAAKFWLVADSIRYHRSDTALVRVWVPVVSNDEAAATATGERFVQALFPELRRYLHS